MSKISAKERSCYICNVLPLAETLITWSETIHCFSRCPPLSRPHNWTRSLCVPSYPWRGLYDWSGSSHRARADPTRPPWHVCKYEIDQEDPSLLDDVHLYVNTFIRLLSPRNGSEAGTVCFEWSFNGYTEFDILNWLYRGSPAPFSRTSRLVHQQCICWNAFIALGSGDINSSLRVLQEWFWTSVMMNFNQLDTRSIIMYRIGNWGERPYHSS